MNTAFNRRAGETPALLSFASRFVEIEYMILVEIGPERRVLFNLQPPEQLARVARLVVVGTQHLRSHRLTESAAAGDAAIAVLGVEARINQRYQRCLVNIFMRHDVSECFITFINICTHSFLTVAGVICPQFRDKDNTKFRFSERKADKLSFPSVRFLPESKTPSFFSKSHRVNG